jgi:hypothetical protein
MDRQILYLRALCHVSYFGAIFADSLESAVSDRPRLWLPPTRLRQRRSKRKPQNRAESILNFGSLRIARPFSEGYILIMDQPQGGDLNWRLSAHPFTLLIFLGFRVGSSTSRFCCRFTRQHRHSEDLSQLILVL